MCTAFHTAHSLCHFSSRPGGAAHTHSLTLSGQRSVLLCRVCSSASRSGAAWRCCGRRRCRPRAGGTTPASCCGCCGRSRRCFWRFGAAGTASSSSCDPPCLQRSAVSAASSTASCRLPHAERSPGPVHAGQPSVAEDFSSATNDRTATCNHQSPKHRTCWPMAEQTSGGTLGVCSSAASPQLPILPRSCPIAAFTHAETSNPTHCAQETAILPEWPDRISPSR